MYRAIGPDNNISVHMAEKLGSYQIRLVLWLITGVAAVNWGTVEFLDVNLLSDTLKLGADALSLSYGIIGVAGAVNLYNTVVGDILE